MKNDGIRIRVSDLIHTFFKHRFLIVALTVAGILIGLVFSGLSYIRGEMSREYMVTASVAVNTKVDDIRYSSDSSHVTNNDIYLAEDIVNAVIYVMESDKTLNAAIENQRLNNIVPKDINSNLTLSQYESTQIIEMVLYWRSAEEGIAVLNAIADVSSDILKETLGVGSISMVNAPSAKYLIGGSLNAALVGALGILGMIIGLGVSILELLMRPTILNTRDLEDYFGLEVLGEVPSDNNYFKQDTTLLNREYETGITESFGSLAHIVRNRAGSKEKNQIIFITSASRNEGRTTAVANLAIQLSDMEKRVLMIDFDTRNPQLGNMFLQKVEYDHSLNALYRGDINEQEAITTLTGYLDILPAVYDRSPIPLDSNIFKMVKAMSENYDYVLMDTAPVGITANTLSLNEIASAAIMVVRYDTASNQEIKETLEKLDKSGVRLLGCIANDIKMNDSGIKRQKKSEKPAAKTAAKAPKFNDIYGESNESTVKTDPQGIENSEDFAEMLFKMYDKNDNTNTGENNSQQ